MSSRQGKYCAVKNISEKRKAKALYLQRNECSYIYMIFYLADRDKTEKILGVCIK
jgi:hypothetical protein